MTVYAYLRVSTEEQDYENQRYGIIKYCEYRDIKISKEYVDEGVSGTVNYKKRNLGKLLRVLKKGDYVIVSELSRLSRSMIDMYSLAKIFADKEVRVFCLKENLELGNTAIGLMIMTVFAFSAQIERERISERTREALAKRKSEGMKLGRPVGSKNNIYKLTGKEKFIFDMMVQKVSKRKIARKCGVSVITLNRFLVRKDFSIKNFL